MEITPRELRDTEIHSEMRGYSRDEVNELLERAAGAIEAANERVTQLQDRLTSAQSEATRTRETEDILHRTLLLAQRAADEAVAEATAKSRQMVDEAEMSSRRLVADAEAEARRRGETERRRLEQEIVELAGRRDTLLADVEALTRFEAEYRERMVRSLETDLTELRTRPTTAPASKPEPSDVAIPEPTTGASSAVEQGPDTSAPAQVHDPSSTGARPAIEMNGRPADATTGGRETGGAETSEVDVRTLFEQSQEPVRQYVREPEPRPGAGGDPEASARRAPGALGAQSAPGSGDASGAPVTGVQMAGAPGTAAPGSGPLDLAGSESVDANILDDDAFFATLRDAVHDEKPLGPRDEDDDPSGENQFFDQDADRGSFRDVFRRRR